MGKSNTPKPPTMAEQLNANLKVFKHEMDNLVTYMDGELTSVKKSMTDLSKTIITVANKIDEMELLYGSKVNDGDFEGIKDNVKEIGKS